MAMKFEDSKRILTTLTVLSFLIPFSYFILNMKYISEGFYTSIISFILAILAFLISYLMIPFFFEMTKKAGLFGVDLNKIENKEDPDRKEMFFSYSALSLWG